MIRQRENATVRPRLFARLTAIAALRQGLFAVAAKTLTSNQMAGGSKEHLNQTGGDLDR